MLSKNDIQVAKYKFPIVWPGPSPKVIMPSPKHHIVKTKDVEMSSNSGLVYPVCVVYNNIAHIQNPITPVLMEYLVRWHIVGLKSVPSGEEHSNKRNNSVVLPMMIILVMIKPHHFINFEFNLGSLLPEEEPSNILE